MQGMLSKARWEWMLHLKMYPVESVLVYTSLSYFIFVPFVLWIRHGYHRTCWTWIWHENPKWVQFASQWIVLYLLWSMFCCMLWESQLLLLLFLFFFVVFLCWFACVWIVMSCIFVFFLAKNVMSPFRFSVGKVCPVGAIVEKSDLQSLVREIEVKDECEKVRMNISFVDFTCLFSVPSSCFASSCTNQFSPYRLLCTWKIYLFPTYFLEFVQIAILLCAWVYTWYADSCSLRRSSCSSRDFGGSWTWPWNCQYREDGDSTSSARFWLCLWHQFYCWSYHHGGCVRFSWFFMFSYLFSSFFRMVVAFKKKKKSNLFGHEYEFFFIPVLLWAGTYEFKVFFHFTAFSTQREVSFFPS